MLSQEMKVGRDAIVVNEPPELFSHSSGYISPNFLLLLPSLFFS